MYNLEEELSRLDEKSSILDIQSYINKMIEERGLTKKPNKM